MSKSATFDVSLWVFRISAVLLIFLLGGAAAKLEVWPFPFLEKGVNSIDNYISERNQIRPDLLKPRYYKRKGVASYYPDQAANGFTVLQGWFKSGPGLKLIDMKGKTKHTWPVDFFKIWPETSHIFPPKNIPKGPYNFFTQGMHVARDGSVVVNVSNAGTVKLNRCGEVIWRLNRLSHHSVTPDPDGGFWIPVNRDPRKIKKKVFFGRVDRKYILDKGMRFENLLVKVDKNGVVQKEFSVLSALIAAGLENYLFDTSHIKRRDPTHTNDIKLVTPALAAKIAGVNAGDLLISIRQMHMLAILDANTGSLKWYHRGEWLRQHDPEIESDGTISVFNNARKRFSFNRIAGSNIMRFDPVSRKNTIVFPKDKKNAFYSKIMGSHQLLPGGNRLIVESLRGRVFEVTADGKVVWDFIKRYGKKHAALLADAHRVAKDYFTVKNWECK